jgi:acetylglutamate kinase
VSRILVKVGGAVSGSAAEEIAALRDAGHEVIVVHGAGPQITQEMQRRGIRVEFVGGRRRTTRATVDVVRESMQSVNDALCAELGDVAVPVFGDRDGLLAVPVPPLGWVGDPLPCRPRTIVDGLAAGRVPVVAPLAVGPLNVNADDAAAALAVGLNADRILFVTDVPGVLVQGGVAAAIEAGEAERLVEQGHFQGGIVPKLLAAVQAARGGVRAEIGETAVLA